MLRGNHPATVDAKARIKVPVGFRNHIRDTYGEQLFLTSITGENLLVYPLAEWTEFESKLQEIASMTPARRRLVQRVNYYGAMASMDKQGRVLVPQLVREAASIDGEVVVMGQITHLEVWNHDLFRQRIDASPVTEADLQALADLGL